VLRGEDAEERLSIRGDVEDRFDVQNEPIKFALTHQFGSEQQLAARAPRVSDRKRSRLFAEVHLEESPGHMRLGLERLAKLKRRTVVTVMGDR
jgi:hypothetical protein